MKREVVGGALAVSLLAGGVAGYAKLESIQRGYDGTVSAAEAAGWDPESIHKAGQPFRRILEVGLGGSATSDSDKCAVEFRMKGEKLSATVHSGNTSTTASDPSVWGVVSGANLPCLGDGWGDSSSHTEEDNHIAAAAVSEGFTTVDRVKSLTGSHRYIVGRSIGDKCIAYFGIDAGHSIVKIYKDGEYVPNLNDMGGMPEYRANPTSVKGYFDDKCS